MEDDLKELKINGSVKLLLPLLLVFGFSTSIIENYFLEETFLKCVLTGDNDEVYYLIVASRDCVIVRAVAHHTIHHIVIIIVAGIQILNGKS